MASFSPGLFVGADDPTLPRDNLDLERAFKHPKRHLRRIHGRAHAGVGLVQSGATLLVVLDAHRREPRRLSASDLIDYRDAKAPPSQQASLRRRLVMRKARSTKRRPMLLSLLERRYEALQDRRRRFPS